MRYFDESRHASDENIGGSDFEKSAYFCAAVSVKQNIVYLVVLVVLGRIGLLRPIRPMRPMRRWGE